MYERREDAEADRDAQQPREGIVRLRQLLPFHKDRSSEHELQPDHRLQLAAGDGLEPHELHAVPLKAIKQ